MLEDTFLYFPSHEVIPTDLQAWRVDGKVIGYAHPVDSPPMVWLMFHGNGGQAAQRGYIVTALPKTDSVYVMEYPGYGRREGHPSMKSINAAAAEAYAVLKKQFPQTPISVIGESLGSGPASFLCSLGDPPSRAVLITPFDNLLSVAKERIWYLPVGLLMRDKWDNEKALENYKGRIDIYAATCDTIIPIHHAQRLAKSLPNAKFHEINCGHNDWSSSQLVKIGP